MLLSMAILFGLITAWYLLKQKKMGEFIQAMQHATITVSTVKAVSEEWSPYIPTTGSIEAVNGVNISPQISGIISETYFTSGAQVEKGQPLIQIDDRLEQATLKDFEAQLLLAQETYKRDAQLLKDGATSKSTVDSDMASLHEAEANVESTKVQIAYAHITAPFSGIIGINQTNNGQYITEGTTIASLQAINPLFAQFNLPEKYLKQVYKGQQVEVIADAYPEHIYTGEITALDSQLNSETRSLTIQATIQNDDMKLLPGMFANIKVMLPIKKDVVSLPQTAINYNLYGDSVFLVIPAEAAQISAQETENTTQKNLVTKLQYVTVGERRGNKIEILKGVKVGDEVVSSGQLKVNDGEAVSINNSVEP